VVEAKGEIASAAEYALELYMLNPEFCN